MSIVVGIRMLQLRYRAVLQDGLPVGYFQHNRGAKAPAYMLQAEQHYSNLYETPMLFYVVLVIDYITRHASYFSLVLAWIYVVSRLLHAFEHMGQNRIAKRRNVFLLSIVCLSLLWLELFVRLMLY